MSRNPQLERWESRLLKMFEQIDSYLEEKYSGRFRLKPARPPHGAGVTRDADGLFDLGVSFSAGITSKYGPGYVFQIRIATNDPVPESLRQQIENEVVTMLNQQMSRYFPGVDLKLAKEGHNFRIYGDLSLDRELPPLPSDEA